MFENILPFRCENHAKNTKESQLRVRCQLLLPRKKKKEETSWTVFVISRMLVSQWWTVLVPESLANFECIVEPRVLLINFIKVSEANCTLRLKCCWSSCRESVRCLEVYLFEGHQPYSGGWGDGQGKCNDGLEFHVSSSVLLSVFER